MKGLSRAGKISFIVLSIIFLLGISLLLTSPLKTNVRLARFSKQLYDLELPENSKMLEQNKTSGYLDVPNGNNVYCCSIFIESELSKEEILEYYSSHKFLSANEKHNEKLLLHVEELADKTYEIRLESYEQEIL